MNESVEIEFTGPEAEAAIAELMAIPHLKVSRLPAGLKHRADPLTIAVAIIAIASGSVNVVDKILAWRDRWKARRASGGSTTISIPDSQGRPTEVTNLNDGQVQTIVDRIPPI